MEKVKYIRNISEETKQADIYLYESIGDDGITGKEFREEFNFLESLNIDRINVRINSMGGSVSDASTIFMTILNSKKEVYTYNDFFALSSAGWILLAGDKIHMTDVGQFMIHNPSGGSSKALGAVRESLIKVFNKRTGMDENKLSEMMEDETWINSEDCKNKYNFIDEIIDTSRVLQKVGNSMPAEIFNKFLIKKEKMKDLANKLKLNDDAKEVDFITKVEELENEAKANLDKIEELEKTNNEIDEALNAKNSELDETANKIEELENKIEELKEAEKGNRIKVVNSIIDDAVEAGKIKKDSKKELSERFTNDVEGLEAVINSLNSFQPAKITNELEGDEGKTDGKESWNMRDWEKKDPDGLAEMRNNEPKKFDKLFNEYYKK